jgi:hypothetical protein
MSKGSADDQTPSRVLKLVEQSAEVPTKALCMGIAQDRQPAGDGGRVLLPGWRPLGVRFAVVLLSGGCLSFPGRIVGFDVVGEFCDVLANSFSILLIRPRRWRIVFGHVRQLGMTLASRW